MDFTQLNIGDKIKVKGYSEINEITVKMSHGYGTKYLTIHNGKPLEMTISSVPFSFVESVVPDMAKYYNS